MSSILFVCTGNTCRSPMAAALSGRHGAGSGISAASAGVGAAPGLPASPGARAALAEMGLSLDAHRSRPVEPADIERADLVLTMEEWQRDLVAGTWPEARVHTLGAFAGPGRDVADPAGGDLAAYRRCARELDALVEQAVARLISPESGRE